MSPSRLFPTVHCDADSSPTSRAASAIKTVKSAMSVPENELKRWKRLFEAHASTVVEGHKYVSHSLFFIDFSDVIVTVSV